MYKVPTPLPARTSMHYRWWWNIVPDKSSTRTGIWIETRSINSRRFVDLDQRDGKGCTACTFVEKFQFKRMSWGCECGRDLFTAVIRWIKMHFALFIRDENVCVGYCTLRYASVSYDFGVIGGTLYLTRDACTMTRRLFNIFGYAKENYNCETCTLSVFKGSLWFSTRFFLFIYSFVIIIRLFILS